MSMTPQEKREFQELKDTVKALHQVKDVSFIAEAKRRITRPVLIDLGIDQVVSKDTVGTTAGVLKTVAEGGAATYSVADAYDGTITIRDVDGTLYKIGYYN